MSTRSSTSPTVHIPYSRQDVDAADIAAVTAVLRSDFLTQGPAVSMFERAFAARHEVAHAVAVSNATAALHIACLAMGIGPGKRVWTSPISFLASANCALYCGAQVDFVDIDPVTRNLSLDALADKLERAAFRNALPDLLVPVDFSGLPCDLREMRELADRYGFQILEDASHATGATYLGRPVGSVHAHASVFSFHAVKVVTTAEGGIVATQDAALAKRLRLLRSHGMTRDVDDLQEPAEGEWVYEQQVLGFNYRMTDLQAALGRSQLERLPAMQEARTALADRYDHLFADLPLCLPPRLADRSSAWHLYAIEIDAAQCSTPRAAVFSGLRRQGIGVNVHYIPIHTQPFYRGLGFERGDFPAAERYYAQALSIPLFPAMTTEQQDRVADALRSALGRPA
jgi:UDP-4-amino-4,6-dideoxy-N-acetyl-beta-L-altrosamine transaminase